MIWLLNSWTRSSCGYLHGLSPAAFLHGCRRGQFRSLLGFMPLQDRVPLHKGVLFYPWLSTALVTCFGPKTMPSMMHTKTYKSVSPCVQPPHCIVYQVEKTWLSNRTRWLSEPGMPVVTADQPSATHQIRGRVPQLPADWGCMRKSRGNQNTTQLGPAPSAEPMMVR